MRGYVEMLERLESLAPEGHAVTDAEILDAMAENYAYRLDAARDARREEAWREPHTPPVGAKPTKEFPR
jgi:hypothetical protein